MIGSTFASSGARILTLIGLIAAVILVAIVVGKLRSDGAVDSAQRSNRRNNVVVLGLVWFVAIDLLPDLADEKEWLHRADEIVVMLIAAVALFWFLAERRYLDRSTTPLKLAAALLVTKGVGLWIERGDLPDAEGDAVLLGIGVVLFMTLVLAWRGRPFVRRGA